MKRLGFIFCIYFSIIYGVCTGFKIEQYRGFVLILAIFFFLYWSILSSDFFSSHMLLRWIQYVQYFVLAAYIFGKSGKLLQGGKALSNQLFDVLNTTFHREFTYYTGVDESTAQADILIFVAILLVLYSGILLISRRYTWVVLIETMPVMILLMIFAPQAVHGDFFAYFAGLTGMYYLEHSKEKMAILGFAFLMAGAGFFLVYPSTELFGQDMTSVRQGCMVIAEYVNHISNGETSVFTLNFGDLKNEATKKNESSGKVTLRMKSVENVIYLRSYAGKEYEKGKWSLDHVAANEEMQLEDYESLFHLDSSFSRTLRPSIKEMELSNQNDDQELRPYYVIESDDQTESITYVSIHDYDQFLSNSSAITEALWNQDDSRLEEASAIYDEKKAVYTSVSKGLKKDFQKVVQDFAGEDSSIVEKISNLKLYFKNHYTYTASAGMTPNNEDPTSYFLLQSKRGDISQYASAAVLLLRSMDIPARYAEGYLVNENDIKDATMTNGKMVISVGDENSYAWAEVYVKGIGWIPMDPVSADVLIAASDAREIELPSLPKLTVTPSELLREIGKAAVLILLIGMIRVCIIYMIRSQRKKKMSARERILWYARVWERYKYTDYNEEIQTIIEQVKYSNHKIEKEQEEKVYHAVFLARKNYRKKLPIYMNFFDMFIACRDIL
jgi:hypothetical protein